MATTRPNQEQLEKSFTYDDTVTPSQANYETNPVDVEDDFNAVRSAVNNILNRNGSAFPTDDWYDDIAAPTVFSTDPGASTEIRGVTALGNDLWGMQRKRVLKRRAMVGVDVTIAAAGDRYVILAAADLPTTTTAAVGAVTTTGTVVAHNATFGTATLDEVTGANALQPKNLMILTNNATGDVVTRTSDGKQIFGLFQSENSTNGSTITGTTPNRVQISFVVHNAANDDLELIASGDMNGITFDYAYVERHALEDLPEESFLGEGFADTGVSASTRQAAYDNQGTAIVTTASNATLDLGTGFLWEIGDLTSANLFRITEGSTGGTTNLTIGADVDTYDNNAVDVDFNNGITVDNGSDPINIGVTVDQIDFTGNATITGTSGSSITVNAVAANANLTTTTSGNVVVTSAGLVDVNSTTTVTVDGTGISIDGTTASNFSVTGADLILSTITTGELDLTSAGLMDVNAGANLDVDVTGTFDVLATGAGSIDFTGASNLSVASGNLTVSTTTTGNLIMQGAVNVDIESGTGDIDITAATSVDVTSGSTADITATAGRNILLTADVAEFDVSLQDVGHWHDRADFHYFGDTNRGDNYLTVNAQYVSSTATSGGWVKVTSAATVTNGTITATTAGVAATSNPVITTSGITGLTAGTIILIEGAFPRSLNGLYEVLSGATAAMTIRGIGLTGTVEDFTKSQVETEAAASGTIYTATVAVMRNSTSGVFQVASGSSTPLTFTNLSTGTSTLQQAYEAGNTISVVTAEGTIDFTNTTDATDTLTVSRTFAGGGDALTVNMGASTTGLGIDVNITAGATGNAVDIANAGSGDALFVNNTGAGDALDIQDGGSSVLQVTGAGAVTITPTSGTNFTATVAAAGVLDLNAGAGGVDIDASGASAFTVTGAALTLETVTSGALTVTSAGVLDADAASTLSINSSGGAINVGNDANAFAINVGTGAAARTITVGNATGATALDFNSGTGGVTIDTVSGGISLDAAAGASNFTVAGAALTLSTTTSGNVIVAAATNVDVDGTSVLIDATSAVSIDAAAASNLSTSAGTLTVSNSSATATDDVAISANAGDVDVTSTSGNFSITATSGDANTSSSNTRVQITNTSATGATAPGVVLANSWRNYFQSGTQGDLFLTFGTAYTSSTGTTNGQVYVVSTTTADTVAGAGFTAGVSGTSNATVGTTGAATFSAGDIVLISHEGGATRRENLGLFEVHTHAANVLTVRGMLTAITAGAEWASRNFRTDATTGATIRLAQATVFRVNSAGQAQIAESFTNSTGISYQDIGSSGVTLANVVTNQAGTAFTAGAFDTQWGISNGQFLEFGDASNNGVLTIRGDNNAEAITGLGGNTSAGAGQTITFTGGTATTSGQAGGAVMYAGGAGLGAGAGGNSTAVAGAGGSTGTGGTAFLTGGAGGSISGAAGGCTISGGTPIDGNGGTITVSPSAGVGTNRSGGTLTLVAGASTGSGTAGSITATAGAPASGAGTAGILDFDGGAGGPGTAGASPQNASAGGSASMTGGTGGAADAGAVAAQGADGAAGGAANVVGGTGGAGEAGVDPGAAGVGGAGNLAGGIGGAGAGTSTGGQTAANGGIGGTINVTGGRGGAGSAGTVSAAASGNGGTVNVTGGAAGIGAGTGDNGSGGFVNITGGAADNTGSGAAGTAGIVSIRTPSGPSTTITQAATVVRFNNQGSGTGGGQVMDLFTGTAAPTHTASAGSLFLFDNATTGRLYVNESSGGSGTTWSQVQTSTSTVSRNFFQDTMASTVSPGSTITAASLTGGVIAVKPSSGFSFNIDAQIFLNGIHLMNGSGNEVTSGTGNGITVETGGPTFRTGDIITIIYHTNSTNNTA